MTKWSRVTCYQLMVQFWIYCKLTGILPITIITQHIFLCQISGIHTTAVCSRLRICVCMCFNVTERPEFMLHVIHPSWYSLYKWKIHSSYKRYILILVNSRFPSVCKSHIHGLGGKSAQSTVFCTLIQYCSREYRSRWHMVPYFPLLHGRRNRWTERKGDSRCLQLLDI